KEAFSAEPSCIKSTSQVADLELNSQNTDEFLTPTTSCTSNTDASVDNNTSAKLIHPNTSILHDEKLETNR
ncbi:6429_t:CDS:1, partial [Cetraspora pellucida]